MFQVKHIKVKHSEHKYLSDNLMSLTVLIFAIAYLIGLFMALAKGAHWAFYIYQFVYFLNPEDRWWSHSLPSFGYSMVTVIMLIFTYMIAYKKYTLNHLTKLPHFKWFIIIIICYVVVYQYAIVPEKHYRYTTDFFKMLIVIGLAYKVLDTQQKLEWALIAYLVGSTYIGYEAYVVGRDQWGRVEGIGMVDAPEANGTAAAIAPTVALLIFYFWKGGIKMKIATTLMGVFILNGLILINSRGAFLGAAVSGLYFMFEMFKGKIKFQYQKQVAFALILLGLIGISVLVDESFVDRMYTLTEVEDESKSGSHRYRLWLIAIDQTFEYPIGSGIFGFQYLSPAWVPEELFIGGQKRKAVHSIWMQGLTEIGWIGFAAFMLIIFYCFRFLSRIKKQCIQNNDLYNYYLAHALLSAYLGILVASTFIDQFRVQTVYWMFLFISCYYSIMIINKNRSDESEQMKPVQRKFPGT